MVPFVFYFSNEISLQGIIMEYSMLYYEYNMYQVFRISIYVGLILTYYIIYTLKAFILDYPISMNYASVDINYCRSIGF